MYTLYLKQHNVTGLKYLGVTSRDPSVYKGSGLYWSNHLKLHGNNVTTEILIQTESRKELAFWGLEFSKTFNIVKSNEFANLIEETGQQVYRTGQQRKRKPLSLESLRKRGEAIKLAHSKKTPEQKAAINLKIRDSNLGVKRSEQTKIRVRLARAKQIISEESKKKRSETWRKKRENI